MSGTTRAYIGLGSNLHDPVAQINAARTAIASLDSVGEQAFSSLYRSPPMGPQDQPAYINAVMGVETELSPMDLLVALHGIENEQGRIRSGERWGPRTIDLDLLLFGRACIRTEALTVPHYGLAERPFVLYPLAEITSNDLLIPGQGSLKALLARCSWEGLERL